jgi:hypothetical protein
VKWIAALLMIVNVAVYLSAGGQHVTVDVPASISKPDVNKEGMLLLSETGSLKKIGSIKGTRQPVSALIEPNQDENQNPIQNPGQVKPETPKTSSTSNEQQDDQPTVTGLAEGESAAIQIQQSGTDLDEASEEIAAAGQEQQPVELVQVTEKFCYRLGPFKKQETWLTATEWMEQNNYEFRQVTSDSRELRAVRVYLGPYDTIISAQASVTQLKEKSLDHFVYLIDNEQARISLGYFTQEELAAKFLTYLQSIGVDAKSQPEYRRLGPFNWMEIPVDGVDQNRISTHDWIEPTVDFSKVQC